MQVYMICIKSLIITACSISSKELFDKRLTVALFMQFVEKMYAVTTLRDQTFDFHLILTTLHSFFITIFSFIHLISLN